VGDMCKTVAAVVFTVHHKLVTRRRGRWNHRFVYALDRYAELSLEHLLLQDEQEMGGLAVHDEEVEQLRLPRHKARKRPIQSYPDAERTIGVVAR
jgi:hypothetical protein